MSERDLVMLKCITGINKLKFMKQVPLFLLMLLWMTGLQKTLAQSPEPVDYVNPLIGTLSKYELSTGNTYPAIARPWGMNFWTPQTGNMGDGWIYTYTADKIK